MQRNEKEIKFGAIERTVNQRKFPAKMNSCSILDDMANQEEISEKRNQAPVKKMPNVEKMCFDFTVFLQSKGYESDYNPLDYFSSFLPYCRPEYTANDIAQFALKLPSFEDEKNFNNIAGPYLSALIHISNDQHFIIHAENLREPLNYFAVTNLNRYPTIVTKRKDIAYYGTLGEGPACGIHGWKMNFKNEPIRVYNKAKSDKTGKSEFDNLPAIYKLLPKYRIHTSTLRVYGSIKPVQRIWWKRYGDGYKRYGNVILNDKTIVKNGKNVENFNEYPVAYLLNKIKQIFERKHE